MACHKDRDDSRILHAAEAGDRIGLETRAAVRGVDDGLEERLELETEGDTEVSDPRALPFSVKDRDAGSLVDAEFAGALGVFFQGQGLEEEARRQFGKFGEEALGLTALLASVIFQDEDKVSIVPER